MASVTNYREIYKGTPIDRSTRSIRLLSLSSWEGGGGATGVLLRSFQLISAPPYTAVSYTWGDPNPPPEPQSPLRHYLLDPKSNKTVSPGPAKSSNLSRTIRVNGKAVKVTENLRAFISHVNRFDMSDNHILSQWYWIDALCINQDDNEERTHQVGMMGDIYSSAALVHIWLGPSTSGSDRAIEHMKKVAAWGGSVVYLPDHVEACLKSLFHRTFWSRIWIFQEVLLAKTIEVSCGSKTMGWETLDLFHDILQRAQLGRTMKGNAESIFGSHALRLIQNRKSIQRLKPINMAVALAYLIEATTPMEATDQRDKVYALLGLSERLCLDCKASRLQADYEKTLHTIVTDVLCYLTEGEVFQHQINKFLVTRLLKESLGITTDDAYAAARASGTMTDEELKQLQTVIEAKGGHEVRKVLRAVSNSESRGAATLHERWMLRISTLRRDHIPTLDLTSLLEEDNYRRGTDRAILNQLPYRKGLLLDGHDRLPGEI